MTITTEHFESIEQMAREIRATEPLPNTNNASTHEPDSFTDYMSLDETLSICIEQNGYWKKATEAIHKIAIGTPTKNTLAKSHTRRPERNYAGARPHVPATIAGASKPYLRPTRKPRFKPVIKIAVPTTGNAGIEQYQFYNRGAAILSAVQALERSGYQVQLDAALLIKGNADPKLQYQFLCTVKQPHERLSAADLGFIFTHCNITRRIMFGLMERRPELVPETHHAYGKPGDTKLLKGEYQIVLPTIDQEGYNSKEQADRTIQSEFKRQLEQQDKAA